MLVTVRYNDKALALLAECYEIVGRGTIIVLTAGNRKALEAVGFPDNPFRWIVNNRTVRSVETLTSSESWGLVLSGKEIERLTEEKIKWYVEHEGFYCPYCHHAVVETVSKPEEGDYMVLVEMKCQSCLRHWKDVHTLTGVREM